MRLTFKYSLLVQVITLICRHLRDIRLEINRLALYDTGIQYIHRHKQAIRESNHEWDAQIVTDDKLKAYVDVIEMS